MEVNRESARPSGERRAQRYHSPLRAERAADTRRRIATAALELFTEHGFGGTTVAAIAERAGVAAQTIYAAFGTKAGILLALLAQLEEDAGAAEWRERIAAADDPPAKLAAFAHWSAAMFTTSKAAITATQDAVGDPAILELRAEADRHRRQALTALVGILADQGALAPGLSRQRAVDRAWMLTGVELYLAATDGCGWADGDYASWLAGLLGQQLLAG
ncbi:MAG: TetR/AcrR family transcriptional regulator [Actinobacteria bacterium]|nr:TetR/AcrR family transcriptional regulator [Actinomycetota bacterium]